MNILIAGGTGFIGTELIHSLLPHHTITVLSRTKTHITARFGNAVQACAWDDLSNLKARPFDVVINLAGHNIAASRWSVEVKKRIIDSRVKTNAALIDWLISQQAKPHFYCANAIGIYGMQENGDPEALDEDSPIDFEHPKDFLSEVGVQWEQSLQTAIDYGMPVTTTRFGVVLKKGDGMLQKLALSFQLGLGSVIGNGEQIISWVHIDDVVRGYHFLLNNPHLLGAFNLTSPNPVSQKTFAKTLAQIMNRPQFLNIPAVFIRLLFGEMGECLINRGQRVVPKRLTDAGFKFKYPDLRHALAEAYNSQD